MAEDKAEDKKQKRLEEAVNNIEELVKGIDPRDAPEGSLELGNDIVEGMKTLMEMFDPSEFEDSREKTKEAPVEEEQGSLSPAQRLFGG